MKACLAILAHAAAAPTIRDFQPRWTRLGFPVLAFLPEGEAWPGAPVEAVIHQGTSQHAGAAACARFLACCRTLLRSAYDVFVIMEYDTVNLTDELPAIGSGAVNCGLMKTSGGDTPPDAILAFSPWIVTRPLLAALIECLQMEDAAPQFPQWVRGLLDRWIGTAIHHRLALQRLPQCVAWPPTDLAAAGAAPPTFVHGWKSRAQFGDLWPT